MKWQAVFVVAGLGLLNSVVGLDNSESPECLSKCWDNSKYVSSCTEAGGTGCLCEDAQFQNVVLQCLYSQCQTTQFGSALHHALSHCSEFGIDATEVLPPLIRHQGLRKRGNQPMASVSAHVVGHYVSASAVHLLARHSVGVSAFVSARPTRSVARLPVQATNKPNVTVSKSATSPEPSNGAFISSASVPVPSKTS